MSQPILFKSLKTGDRFKREFGFDDEVYEKTETEVIPTQTKGTDALGTKTTNAIHKQSGEKVYISKFTSVIKLN